MLLRYLYVGSSDTERDLAAWLCVPGASLRWRFQHFGADVAAVDLGSAPAVLIADHRPSGTILPIYSVDDLDLAVAALEGHGWTVHEHSLGTPEGLAAVVSDPTGTHIALLQVERPNAMEAAYASEDNTHAVRPPPP
jgi:hypothetical protein